MVRLVLFIVQVVSFSKRPQPGVRTGLIQDAGDRQTQCAVLQLLQESADRLVSKLTSTLLYIATNFLLDHMSLDLAQPVLILSSACPYEFHDKISKLAAALAVFQNLQPVAA